MTALSREIEMAIRRAIVETIDEAAPGWICVPRDERDLIVRSLRLVASEIRGSRFLRNRAALV